MLIVCKGYAVHIYCASIKTVNMTSITVETFSSFCLKHIYEITVSIMIWILIAHKRYSLHLSCLKSTREIETRTEKTPVFVTISLSACNWDNHSKVKVTIFLLLCTITNVCGINWKINLDCKWHNRYIKTTHNNLYPLHL